MNLSKIEPSSNNIFNLLWVFSFIILFTLIASKNIYPNLIILYCFIISSLYIILSISFQRSLIITPFFLYILLIYLFSYTILPFYWDPNYLVWPYYGAFFSTIDIAATYSLCCTTFSCGMILGGFVIKHPKCNNKKNIQLLNIKIIFLILLSIFIILLSYWMYPENSVLDAGYGSETLYGGAIKFGMGQGIINIILIILFLNLLSQYSALRLILFIVTLLITIFWFSFMRGNRVESIGLLIGLYVINKIELLKEFKYRLNPLLSRRLDKLFKGMMFLIIIFGIILGVVRSVEPSLWLSSIANMFNLENENSGNLFSQIFDLINYVLIPTWYNVSYASFVHIYSIEYHIINYNFLLT